MPYALVQNVLSCILLCLLCFTFTGIGLLLLKSLPIRTSPGQAVFLGLASGMGLTGYLVFSLGSLLLLSPTPIYILLLLLLLAACGGWKGAATKGAFRDLAPQGWPEKTACAGTVILLVLAFLLALTPEIGKDALAYHLAVPKIFLQQHGFCFVPGNYFANTPFHTEMLYLVGLFLHGDVLAKGIAFLALPATLLGIRQFSLSHARNEYPWFAMFAFAVIPSIFELSHMAYADLYLALYSMAAVYTFLTWYNGGEKSWLFLCALFTGLAASCKYSALLLPFLASLGVLWKYRRSTELGPALRELSLYLACAIVFTAPFYLKNWVLTGNPVYPFMFQFWGGKGLDAELARLLNLLYKYMGMGRSWSDYLLLPWNMSVHAQMNSTRFDGIIGPMFLISLPFLLGVRKIALEVKLIMFYCLAGFLFWASASQDIRYLTSVLPFLALLSAIILTRYRERKGLFALLGAAMACCLAFNAYLVTKDFLRIRPLAAALGIEGRDAFLGRSLSPYGMYRFGNQALPPDAKVYLVYMKNYLFLCDRACYADSMIQDYTLRKVLDAAKSPEEVRDRMKGLGFSHIMYDEVYITGERSLLSPGEKELFSNYRNKYLSLLKNEGSYYLYRL
jgi:hypothetical protein